MENMQFETDSNEFECIECGAIVKLNKEEVKSLSKNRTRKITCPCGSEYDVAKHPDGVGLVVTMRSESLPELEEITEKELEDDDYDD